MEVSMEKSNIMVNSKTNTSVDITMNGEKLKEATSFKYLGATMSKDGTSTAEVRIRIALATAAMARLSRLWTSSSIRFPTKYRLFKSLVVSILLFGCETWTLHADTERRIQAFEHKCLRRLLRISYTKHETNEYVRNMTATLVGPQEPLLATTKRRKLAWFGHVTRHDSLCKTDVQGTLEGGDVEAVRGKVI